MSDEIRTGADLRTSIVDQRGGIECFDGPQRRLLDALVAELAKRPDAIDVRAVTDLMAMLPRPVSVPEPEANEHAAREAAIKPLRRLFRNLHESVATLTSENAALRARLGLPSAVTTKNAITPPTADIVPACERASMDAGPQPGPDDWRAPRPGPVIDGKVNAPAASEQGWDATPNGKAWRDWHDAGGSVGGDRWSNRNIP
jgi:hypothetical protein